MKTIFKGLIILLALNASQVRAQYELYYALKLQKINHHEVDGSKYPQLKKLLDPATGLSDLVDVGTALEELSKRQKALTPMTGSIDTPPSGLLPNVVSILNPKISEGEVLVAVSDVLISRASQELAIAYINRMRTAFEVARKIPVSENCNIEFELRVLFPNLYLLVAGFSENLTMEIGDTFKAAMQKDVMELERNFQGIIPACVKSKPAYSAYGGLRIVIKELKLNTHPALIFDQLQVAAPKNRIEQMYNFLGGLSNSLLTSGGAGQTAWLGKEDLKKLNTKGYAHYLALIYRNPVFKSILDGLGITEKQLVPKLRQFLLLASRFGKLEVPSLVEFNREDYTVGARSKPDEKPANLMEAIPLEYVESIILELLRFASDDQEEVWVKAFKAAQFSKAFYEHITQKEYGAAVLTFLRIFEQYADPDKIPKELTKYVTLAADIAQADSISRVKNIFENAIMPVNSYKVKRRSAFTTTINAYVGAMGGIEWIDNEDTSEPGGFITPYIPLGLEASWSSGNENKASGSMSVFFQLIDLGGFMNYHLGANPDSVTIAATPDIKFRNVLSPGLNVIYGFKNSPLSLGAGASYSPMLREITKTGEPSVMATAFRFGISLTMDIPLFQLSIRGRRQKNK